MHWAGILYSAFVIFHLTTLSRSAVFLPLINQFNFFWLCGLWNCLHISCGVVTRQWIVREKNGRFSLALSFIYCSRRDFQLKSWEICPSWGNSNKVLRIFGRIRSGCFLIHYNGGKIRNGVPQKQTPFATVVPFREPSKGKLEVKQNCIFCR